MTLKKSSNDTTDPDKSFAERIKNWSDERLINCLDACYGYSVLKSDPDSEVQSEIIACELMERHPGAYNVFCGEER